MSTPATAPTSTEVWTVATGVPFSAALIDPTGLVTPLGARIEVPGTGQIVSYWRQALLEANLWVATLDGPTVPGDYELVWMTNDDPVTFESRVALTAVDLAVGQASLAKDFPDVDEAQVTPRLQDVATLERTRTVDANGGDLGTFTDTTRPTVDEVTVLIEQARSLVLAQLAEQIDPRHYRQVRQLIALQTALLIEGSFYREQENRADLWERLYDASLLALQTRIGLDFTQANLIGGMEPWNESKRNRWLA